MKLNDQDITSALGIMWNPVTDNFLFSFQPKNQYAVITKCATWHWHCREDLLRCFWKLDCEIRVPCDIGTFELVDEEILIF